MKGILASIAFIAVVAGAAAQNVEQDKKQLAEFGKQYGAAKAALQKHPGDKEAMRKFVIATDRYATATMTSLALTPHEKYPKALRLYREALKVDPKDDEAGKNSTMIIEVYKSMHRAIPK